MSIQHVDISDSDRHEAKGASTATAKTVCTANGDGTTSFNFVSYNDLSDTPSLGLVAVTSGTSTLSSQLPSAVDTELQVNFGPAVSTTDVDIASDGTITFNTAGTYLIKTDLNFSRVTSTGVAKLMYRFVLNGSQFGNSLGVSLDDNGSNQTLTNVICVEATAGTTLTVELVQMSSGIAVGGLYRTTATVSGWQDVPSAVVSVYR